MYSTYSAVQLRARSLVSAPSYSRDSTAAMTPFFASVFVLSLVVVASLAMPAHDPSTDVSKLPSNATKLGGTFGVDISSLVGESTFKCLKNDGFDFAVVRGYQSFGAVDPNAKASISNARAAGINYVDVYMFPCPKCTKSAANQVREMVSGLSGANYGQIWLDIEGSEYWKGDHSANQKFFEELLSEASRYKTTGVYASEYQWSSIMGTYSGGSSKQLWYPHYDNSASFSDFAPFGGWKRPAIKQYVGDASVCGADVDKDWY